MEGNDNEISKDEAPLSENESSDALGDMVENFHSSHPYLAAQQAQARWEEKYDFAVYSATEQGWLCKVCSEYANVEYWKSKYVK